MNISSCASRLISSCIFFDEATVQISLTIILIGSVVFLLLNWIIRVLYILGKIILTGYMFSKHSLPISDRQLVLSLFAFQQHPLHGPIPTPAPESFDPILPRDAADCSLGPQNMGFPAFLPVASVSAWYTRRDDEIRGTLCFWTMERGRHS